MFLLITTVFIALVVIVINILYFLIQSDRKVLAILKQVDKGRVKLKWRLGAITEITEGVNEVLIPHTVKCVEKNCERFTLKTLREFLQTSIIFFINNRYKKLLLGLEIGYFFGKGFLKK